MKILFLGYAVNNITIEKLSGASIAGNKMQLNILKNLNDYRDSKIDSITIYPVASYPKDLKKYIKKEEISIFENLKSTKIGFVNIKPIKQIWQTVSVYQQAKKMIEKDTIILTFNVFPQIGIPLMMLKKKYNSKTVAILADLPVDDQVNRKGLSTLIRFLLDEMTRRAINKCDKIIALNKQAVILYAPEKEFLIVEGGINPSEIKELSEKNYKDKNIVYSGALTEYSGVLNLIEAMKNIKSEDIFLDIYGGGELEKYIMYLSKEMNNVRYHGKVDNMTMKKLQSEAYLLINPRPVDNPISMVTFPSKIFEYMASGTPVLTTNLNGFTEEYLDKMYFVDNNDPETLANKIEYIMQLPVEDLIKKAQFSRKFVLENKTWQKQCEKIHGFINEW